MITHTPQSIVDHLYAELDAANERLKGIAAPYRFARCIDMVQVDQATEANTPVPPPRGYNPTGMLCECGGIMVQTGSCSTCSTCGESSGGCS
jgi:hypothetical protein